MSELIPSTSLRDAFWDQWILPRPKNCSPALNFYTSVRTGAGLSNPSADQKEERVHKHLLVGVSGFAAFAPMEQIMELPPSSRRQATVHRTVAFNGLDSGADQIKTGTKVVLFTPSVFIKRT